jgi:hypothetical protein
MNRPAATPSSTIRAGPGGNREGFGLRLLMRREGRLHHRRKVCALSPVFYWDRDNETRAWSKRCFDRHGSIPMSSRAAQTFAAFGIERDKLVLGNCSENCH